jgi:hypothetical protein
MAVRNDLGQGSPTVNQFLVTPNSCTAVLTSTGGNDGDLHKISASSGADNVVSSATCGIFYFCRI